LTLIRGM